MATASLLFPAICLFFSFIFTICMYHSSIRSFLHQCRRSIRRLRRKARRKLFKRYRHRQHGRNSGGNQVEETYDTIASPVMETEHESRLSESVISTDESSSCDSSTTESGSDISIIFSVTESEDDSDGNIDEEQSQRPNGSTRYTVLMKSRRGAEESQRLSFEMNTPDRKHEELIPPPPSPMLPEWEQDLQRRIQEGRTPGAWVDWMVDWAVRHFQARVESDTAGTELFEYLRT